MRRVIALASAATLWLAGCASTPTTPAGPPTELSLSGRLAVRVAAQGDSPARSVSALFDLRSSDGQSGDLDLSTPMGTLMGRAHWNPQEVSLTTPQGQRRYPSLSALSEDVLGESVPVQALFDWLQGRPWAGAAFLTLAGDPSPGFTQLGWTVQIDRLADGLLQAQRQSPPQVTVQARLLR